MYAADGKEIRCWLEEGALGGLRGCLSVWKVIFCTDDKGQKRIFAPGKLESDGREVELDICVLGLGNIVVGKLNVSINAGQFRPNLQKSEPATILSKADKEMRERERTNSRFVYLFGRIFLSGARA